MVIIFYYHLPLTVPGIVIACSKTSFDIFEDSPDDENVNSNFLFVAS